MLTNHSDITLKKIYCFITITNEADQKSIKEIHNPQLINEVYLKQTKEEAISSNWNSLFNQATTIFNHAFNPKQENKDKIFFSAESAYQEREDFLKNNPSAMVGVVEAQIPDYFFDDNEAVKIGIEINIYHIQSIHFPMRSSVDDTFIHYDEDIIKDEKDPTWKQNLLFYVYYIIKNETYWRSVLRKNELPDGFQAIGKMLADALTINEKNPKIICQSKICVEIKKIAAAKTTSFYNLFSSFTRDNQVGDLYQSIQKNELDKLEKIFLSLYPKEKMHTKEMDQFLENIDKEILENKSREVVWKKDALNQLNEIMQSSFWEENRSHQYLRAVDDILNDKQYKTYDNSAMINVVCNRLNKMRQSGSYFSMGSFFSSSSGEIDIERLAKIISEQNHKALIEFKGEIKKRDVDSNPTLAFQ